LLQATALSRSDRLWGSCIGSYSSPNGFVTAWESATVVLNLVDSTVSLQNVGSRIQCECIMLVSCSRSVVWRCCPIVGLFPQSSSYSEETRVAWVQGSPALRMNGQSARRRQTIASPPSV